MTKYRVKVEGVRLIEAESPDEAVTQAALEARMMDTVASVLGEQESVAVEPHKAHMGHVARMN